MRFLLSLLALVVCFSLVLSELVLPHAPSCNPHLAQGCSGYTMSNLDRSSGKYLSTKKGLIATMNSTYFQNAPNCVTVKWFQGSRLGSTDHFTWLVVNEQGQSIQLYPTTDFTPQGRGKYIRYVQFNYKFNPRAQWPTGPWRMEFSAKTSGSPIEIKDIMVEYSDQVGQGCGYGTSYIYVLHTWAIVAIAVGGIVVIALIIVLSWCCCCRKRSSVRNRREP